MVDIAAIVSVLGGVVLLFAGAALSVYGVAVLGAILGGSGGYLSAPAVGGAIGLDGLSQFGLFRFGYVARLVALLPGASAFRDRARRTDDR